MKILLFIKNYNEVIYFLDGSDIPGEPENVDISQFMNNPNLLNMASQMLNDPSVRNMYVLLQGRCTFVLLKKLFICLGCPDYSTWAMRVPILI